MKRLFIRRFALLVAGAIALAACTEPLSVPQVELPAQAKSIAVPGVENVHQVSKELYRSGQPDKEGFSALEKMGVRSVLNLRDAHIDARKAAHTELHLMAYPVAARAVTESDVENCLRLLQHSPKPVLVHCRQGSNRTGIVVAAYRIVYQGWSVEAAEKELRDDAYGYSSFWCSNLVKLLRQTDWQAMKQRLQQN